MDAEKLAVLKEQAYSLGHEDGTQVGAWVIDGNTDAATARQWLQWSRDGDPVFWESYRAPLSGEYADDMTPDRLRNVLGVSAEDWDSADELINAAEVICAAYEDGHAIGWEDQIVHAATLIVEPSPDDTGDPERMVSWINSLDGRV